MCVGENDTFFQTKCACANFAYVTQTARAPKLVLGVAEAWFNARDPPCRRGLKHVIQTSQQTAHVPIRWARFLVFTWACLVNSCVLAFSLSLSWRDGRSAESRGARRGSLSRCRSGSDAKDIRASCSGKSPVADCLLGQLQHRFSRSPETPSVRQRQVGQDIRLPTRSLAEQAN